MHSFQIEILSFSTINELPDSWQKTDYLALLNRMDYANPEEIKDSELKEMCLMSFTDLEPAESARIALDYVINGRLTDGQIENLSHEMITEKLWEEYPELSLHPDFFRATQLLYEAYNGKFPKTEAVKFQVKIVADKPEDILMFNENPEAPVVRLLSAGMSDHSLIHRLFSDQLEDNRFDEAKSILWQLNRISGDESSITYEIVSSSYWLDEIKYADRYAAVAHADARVPDEE